MPIDNDLRDAPEPGPQPDPMLDDGRASSTRKWAVTGVIVAVLLAVMYGMTAHRVETQREAAPAASSTPSQPLPGGRGMSSAPPSPATTKPGG